MQSLSGEQIQSCEAIGKMSSRVGLLSEILFTQGLNLRGWKFADWRAKPAASRAGLESQTDCRRKAIRRSSATPTMWAQPLRSRWNQEQLAGRRRQNFSRAVRTA